MRSAALVRIEARFSTSVRDHSANARLAVATASPTSSGEPDGTLSTTASVAGLTTSISSCAAAWRHSPPISISGTGSPSSLDLGVKRLYAGERKSSVIYGRGYIVVATT